MISQKLLLDECVYPSLDRVIMPNSPYLFDCSCQYLGQGAKDDQVLQFSLQNGYVLVTEDSRLVIRAIKSGASIALAMRGTNKAFLLQVQEIIELPRRPAKGAPIKVRNKEGSTTKNWMKSIFLKLCRR